jgi:DNA polymerase III delta prime subunit
MIANRILSLPSAFSALDIALCACGAPFALYYSVSPFEFLLIEENGEISRRLKLSFMCNLEEAQPPSISGKEFRMLSGIFLNAENNKEETISLSYIETALRYAQSGLFICFYPCSQSDVIRSKHELESAASSRALGSTNQVNTGNGRGISVRSENYHGSWEASAELALLSITNEILSENFQGYKFSIITETREGGELICRNIMSNLFLLSDIRFTAETPQAILSERQHCKSALISMKRLTSVAFIPTWVERRDEMRHYVPKPSGDVALGFLDIPGISSPISIDYRVLNLGTIISGLPGTGKTTAAMNIIGKLLQKSDIPSIIISPTKEWVSFASSKKIKAINMGHPKERISLFRCASPDSRERFYEDICMLMASALKAGPYRGPLEKCLLRGARAAYSESLNPDPWSLYMEIEKAIETAHANTTRSSVKYTKHGENIRASLELLRHLLSNEKFAFTDGVSIRDELSASIVFDLSECSNMLKPLMYALILNQVYSAVTDLDECGDNELRMMICIEEAQLIFREGEDSAATEDLMQRIQDFRKKGVGLMLITHNTTDINVGIRRLCQTKLYFRQSPETAEKASEDLLFPQAEEEKVRVILKEMRQGVFALSYIESSDKGKNPKRSLICKLGARDIELAYQKRTSYAPKRQSTTKILINMCNAENNTAGDNQYMEIVHLNHKFGTWPISNEVSVFLPVDGKEYDLVLHLGRKKELVKRKVIGGKENTIDI